METKINTNNKVNQLVLTGLMIAMVAVVTAAIPIPAPFTSGYVHLGDAVIFLSVLLLGWRYGAVAAGVGSALADIFTGYAFWAPWTLFIKAGMAIIMGLFIAKSMEKQGKSIFGVPVYQMIGMLLGGIFMAAGYYIAQGIMYGNFIAAALGIPWNIAQFVVGLVIATLISGALYKSPADKLFAYRPAR
ncbi:ECF transporter S component [Sinanaerobacter chloroacetimidivorans]|uniref:ECF transporter S component n=1 Tax=Sinanaerobacter chloroacetimidivorans TaxID=2818044 RepID=A0A8J7W2A3_9FIRM|nr:ECF transporter S component [Sinanaerobacter chloroacetimidivorans]MBR0597945.1 ECF transporter S component [Sinanaerobacter chloroacetimidivorans]